MMTFREARLAYVGLVRDNLLAREALKRPELAEMIDATAGLAGSLGALDISIRAHGCDLADTRLHHGMTKSLLNSLWLMGPDDVEDTLAEQILVRALITGKALLALGPTVGTA